MQGIVVFQDAGMIARAESIARFVATCGPGFADVCRRLATCVDRLLEGARAPDLPVERPTRIEPALDLRTAGALGVAVAQSRLPQASESAA